MKVANNTVKDMSCFLSEKGIKPSYQRVKILERMINNKNHPTVNDIYTDLIDEIPSLSKTTVYNTLNIFIENNIVKSFSVDGNEARYDINTGVHGHFICISCNTVFDFETTDKIVSPFSLENFDVIQTEIIAKGICSRCKS